MESQNDLGWKGTYRKSFSKPPAMSRDTLHKTRLPKVQPGRGVPLVLAILISSYHISEDNKIQIAERNGYRYFSPKILHQHSQLKKDAYAGLVVEWKAPELEVQSRISSSASS